MNLRLLLLPVLASLIDPASGADNEDPACALRKLAGDYYRWRNQEFPVASSEQGLHTGDDRLTDYTEEALRARRERVQKLIAQVRALAADGWPRDDRIDRALFLAQLEREDFFDRERAGPETDPQTYVSECSNAIFSLLKKNYDAPRTRALSATARLRAMPVLLEQGRRTLTRPVRLYARLAIESARAMDGLFGDSLMTLAADLSPVERAELVAARDRALKALKDFARWLEDRLPEMTEFAPMGEERYNWMLRHVYLLPLDARQVAMLGEAELARYRGLEALLKDPALADPDPSRSPSIPRDQAAFLAAYESRQGEMIRFLREQRLVTLPASLGPFQIRQLPEAFKPTRPGGFMNPPGRYDRDASGFFFIPTFDAKSRNFYLRAAIEDPRPILGHEGIPGHFLQLSIARTLTSEIRREHSDGVFVEGWALYGEEMLMRQGLYPEGSAGQAQVLRLARYRAARIGVDVNLHTGRWTFEQAVKYFMDAGGLDREAAEGEAAGAASEPSQKITYMVGKWQIMRLLGKYRDREGARFRLGAFQDALLASGSLPLSVVEWLLLDDPSSLEAALH
ncbi:MAG TPA: DUF885 domain-containing protein [Vicinamibacteria bacterium]|nr:DUF885 domain-containing protein [Vicinamibacteria bacterium]